MAGHSKRRNEKVYDDFGQLITSPIRPEELGESSYPDYDELVKEIERGHYPKGICKKEILKWLIRPANTPMPPNPTNNQYVAYTLGNLAKDGNLFAISMLYDRAEGKAVQAISGPDGEAIGEPIRIALVNFGLQGADGAEIKPFRQVIDVKQLEERKPDSCDSSD